ncbi:MAG: DNA-processing protein DprA, partial [Vulcanimicrobiaceae bacterium]
RNGIVAALADAVVVIEAPARSGALNTAGWAAGRIPVLAVPGDVDRPQAAGCLALIRDGCTLARDPADVLAELSLPAAQLPLAAPPRERADALERAIVRSLGDGERSLDAIVDACREPVARVSAALTLLEIDGSVQRRDGVFFALMR